MREGVIFAVCAVGVRLEKNGRGIKAGTKGDGVQGRNEERRDRTE